jgi:hypothetical protein
MDSKEDGKLSKKASAGFTLGIDTWPRAAEIVASDLLLQLYSPLSFISTLCIQTYHAYSAIFLQFDPTEHMPIYPGIL